MFNKGETVIIADTFEIGIITDTHDGTYLVKVGEEVREVSEFDIIPDDLEEFETYFSDDDYDDTFEDLQPYRNMNQGYY